MAQDRFEEPVTILVGLGLPVRLETVMDAYGLLQDWPPATGSRDRLVALNACKAWLAGEVDAETVRATLVAFARRHDILLPDLVPLASGSRGAGLSRAGTDR